MRKVACYWWGLALAGLATAGPAQARQAAAPATPADSLARRRAAAPDSARPRLLLLDAGALFAEDPRQALVLAGQARQLAETQRQPARLQAALLLLGRLANSQGDYAGAARYLVQALRLAESRTDTLGQGLAWLNLANTNKRLQLFDKALANARRAQALLAPLARAGRPGAGGAYAKALANSGTVQLEMQRYAPARFDLLASLRQARRLGDSSAAGTALYNLGAVALKLKNGPEAFRFYRQTLAIDQARGDVQAQGESWLNLGDAQALLHHPAEAEAAYGKALVLARQAGALPLVRVVYNGFATLHEEGGRPAQALAWQKRFIALNDSLYEQRNADQAAELQAKYEADQKEARNQVQAAQLREQEQVIGRRNVQLGAGLAIVALLLGLGYLLLNRRRLRREVEFGQERQQLERQRAAAVLEAEEAERRRIGADLHDGVGQLLTVVKLNLGALREDLGPRLRPNEQLRFADALAVVDESVHEVRDISHDLLPNALLKQGLARAVRAFLDKMSRPGRLRINLETLGLAAAHLPPGVEYALYRVVQEAVQNIVKHAHASEINLQLICHADELTLLVEDNGVGFAPAAQSPAAGVGLQNMRSRLAYLGGELTVDSRPGHGTTLTARLPLTA